MDAAAGHALEPSQRQIVGDRHPGEQTSALRYVSDASAGDLGRGEARRILAGDPDRARSGWSDADHRLQQRRLAGAVAAKQCHDFVLAHVERDGVEDVALAIEGVDLIDHQERRRLGRRGARLGGERRGAGADIDLAHLGVVAGILGGAVDQHTPFVHDGDMVGDLEHPVDVVLDEQHGNFRGDGRQQRGDARALGGGESGERLVQQQDSRPCRNGETHVEQALPAVGERACFRLFDAAEAEKVDKPGSLLVHLRHCRGRGP